MPALVKVRNDGKVNTIGAPTTPRRCRTTATRNQCGNRMYGIERHNVIESTHGELPSLVDRVSLEALALSWLSFSATGRGRCNLRYAADRWAMVMLRVVTAEGDPKTVKRWANLLGVSRTTLVTWCRATGVPAKSSLDLGRLLRAVALSRGNLRDLLQVLDIAEPRTAERLLRRAGLRPDMTVGVLKLLDTQRLVRKPEVLESLREHLYRHGFR